MFGQKGKPLDTLQMRKGARDPWRLKGYHLEVHLFYISVIPTFWWDCLGHTGPMARVAAIINKGNTFPRLEIPAALNIPVKPLNIPD